MIHIGTKKEDKPRIIQEYRRQHDINRVVMLSQELFDFEDECIDESIDWPEIIEYRTFYRLLREIDEHTLVVVNECLRTQNRYDLTYNCMRHYLAKTRNVLIFQWLPIIDTVEDFMILFDFDTQSRFKREHFGSELINRCQLMVMDRSPRFTTNQIEANTKLERSYQKKKDGLFKSLGQGDPDKIPRNLHLMAGKERLKALPIGEYGVDRNARLKDDRIITYANVEHGKQYTVIDFPHNFIRMADFLTILEQTDIKTISTNLKVDLWYKNRYNEWARRVADAIASIH